MLSYGPGRELASTAVALRQQAHPAGGQVQVAAQVLTGERLVDFDVVYFRPVLPVAPQRGGRGPHTRSCPQVHVHRLSSHLCCAQPGPAPRWEGSLGPHRADRPYPGVAARVGDRAEPGRGDVIAASLRRAVDAPTRAGQRAAAEAAAAAATRGSHPEPPGHRQGTRVAVDQQRSGTAQYDR